MSVRRFGREDERNGDAPQGSRIQCPYAVGDIDFHEDDLLDLLVNPDDLSSHPDFAGLAECLRDEDGLTLSQIAERMEGDIQDVRRLCSKAWYEGYLEIGNEP